MPEPFKGKQCTSWALIHGTPAEGAQNILLEGFIRPANWAYNPDHRKFDIPTFGGYYLGLEISREDIIGALYRGAENHISFKAGGSETAQLNIPHCGIVTKSEMYMILCLEVAKTPH